MLIVLPQKLWNQFRIRSVNPQGYQINLLIRIGNGNEQYLTSLCFFFSL